MSEIPNGTEHPPPARDERVKKFSPTIIAGRIAREIGLPLSYIASLIGKHSDFEINPAFLDQIKEALGLEKPLPEQSLEGSAWTLGSLTEYIAVLKRQAMENTP